MLLLLAILPALGLCMVTPQAESNKRKRTTELDIVESPVPAEQVIGLTASDGLPSDEPRSLAELLEPVEPEGIFQEDDDISSIEFEELLRQFSTTTNPWTMALPPVQPQLP
jgi:hypothetical protein